MAGAVIRANRAEVNDRFPMLGFTVRTGARPYFEAVVTTDATLLDSSQRDRRGPDSFWSSRGLGPLPSERGEAVFIVPDAVLRRFAGAERLYYSIATFTDRTRSSPEVSLVSPDAAPYVTLSSGYTGRRLRQLVGGHGDGIRWNGNGGRYAPNDTESLTWAGDAVQPGVEPERAASGTGNGNGVAAAAASYDDGYEPALWRERSRRTPASRGLSDNAFDIGWADVPMVPEGMTVPGWLAAAAMLVGWRDRGPGDAMKLLQQLAGLGTGLPTAPLKTSDVAAVAKALGLEPEEPTTLTVEKLRQLVATRGPQWIGVAGVAPRYVVATGLYGDGTPAGTYVRISDPSTEPLGPGDQPFASGTGMGSSYVLTFQQLLDAFGAVAPGDGLQAIHVTEADMQGRVPLVTSQAYALSPGGSRARPARRAPSRAQAVPAVVPIVSAIVGATMTRIMNNEGDVSWELDQLKGLKHPADDATRSGTENFRTVVTPVSGWPKVKGGIHEIDALADEIYADFEMEWQCNGHSVGNVAIKNTHNNDAVGHGLAVKATINDDSTVYEGDLAALRVSFNYQFSRSVGSNAVAIRDFTLYADGTLHEDARWTQQPDGWWGATEQRLARAQGAGATLIAEAAGPIIETAIEMFKQSLEDDITMEWSNLKGWKHVNDDPGTRGSLNVAPKTITVKGPQMGIDYLFTESTIKCDLLITFSYDGSSVGDILIRPTSPNDPPGGGLKIKGEVYNTSVTRTTASGSQCAAIQLSFTYTFTYKFDSVEYRSFDVLLYGDGTHEVIRHD